MVRETRTKVDSPTTRPLEPHKLVFIFLIWAVQHWPNIKHSNGLLRALVFLPKNMRSIFWQKHYPCVSRRGAIFVLLMHFYYVLR
jgi:hypothetical protein